MNYSNEQLHDLVDKGIPEGCAKIVLKQLIDNQLPSAKKLQIFKHPSNTNMAVLEPNDVVKGYASDIKFVTAVFRGGDDSNNWANYEILEETNIEIQ